MDKNDRELFLEALNSMPPDVHSLKFDGAPKPTKRKSVRHKPVHDIVLDLHGSTRAEALARLRTTLERTRGKRRRILVITGRGNNSEEGYGVLREAVGRFLETSGAAYVRGYGFASPKHGGDGAYDIMTK